MSAHLEPISTKVERIKTTIDQVAAFAPIVVQAAAFTYTVESFLRAGDGSDPRVPPTESEVADALYALRAAIAKATGSGS